MSTEITPALQDALTAAVGTAVRAEFQPLFTEMNRFLDRRIAELSAELHASVQLADMSEERIARELAQVHERIANLVAVPAEASRNSGVELEAVVMATESAANVILEAAEAIQDWITGGPRDAASMQGLADKVNAIFEACSFQDVTGQRIRRAIQHLQQVESMLERVLPGQARPAETKVVVRTQMQTVAAAPTAADLAQADIDALLNA
jgi:chemotaxis protein CheZ